MEKQEKEFVNNLKKFQTVRNSIAHSFWHEEEKEENLTELLLNLLSNRNEPKYKSFSDELSALSDLISKISEAIDEGILSESEAENLIKYMFSAFLSRRIDNVVNNLFTKTHSNWFLAAKREFYEGRGKE